MIRDYIKLSRPKHVVKNFLILLPPFFGQKLLAPETLKTAAFAFLSFSAVAAAVYVINDLADVENDRRNDAKKNRPIASGRISVPKASVFAAILLIAGFAMLAFADHIIPTSILLLVYFVLNIAYSLKLKNIPVVDVFILASGFVLRVYFGGFWFDVVVSPWLFLCILCGALFFAFGKRRNEMLNIPPPYPTRPVLNRYTLQYLTSCYYLFCALTIVFFSLWTILATTQHTMFMYTLPIVVFIIMRYNLIIETEDTSGDPVSTLWADKLLIFLVLVFAILSFIGLYCS